MSPTWPTLLHPNLLTALGTTFFGSTVDIQEASVGQNSYGEVALTWSNLSGHAGLNGALAPMVGSVPRQAEGDRADLTPTDQDWHCTLKGNYPSITTSHRAVISSVAYDIEAVEHDSHSTMTRLRLRRVTT
jgi:hypothetical protein